ncbi:hypothetical protein [Pelagicoccus sp. SDUM812003]|uniref:hypothetical protein n=1 Tax=Pelagicoccus sp. SDUM812003 TaxID=3041267 RepID=UPI00280CEBE1|nr:hypothetical protein [Pelagicoccus sp. SDUM812003]MDQ8205684.1 hypothetical protein [Pelagicoccus sp. SDUM812003]
MKPASYPEANRLIYRIRTAITGESVGLGAAKLAWQLAEACERANTDLKAARQSLDQGDLLQALLIAHAHPELLETASSLNFNLFDTWKKRCEIYAWRPPAAIDHESLNAIKSAIAETAELKKQLYKDYRSKVRSKDPVAAYRIIRLIADRFPEDESAQEEAKSHQGKIHAYAVSEIKNAVEQLIPAEPPERVLASFLALGVELDKSEESFVRELYEKVSAQSVAELTESVEAVVQAGATLDESGDWQDVEKRYLSCDYELAIREARGEIPTDLRHDFEHVSTKLSRLRRNYESIISIRIAIKGLYAKPGDPDLPQNAQGKPHSLAHRLEKLRSLESQAQKTAGQLPPDLQKELKDAYAYARSKNMPKLVGLSAAAIIVIAAAVWGTTSYLEATEREQRQAQALAALQQAEAADEIVAASSSLDTWRDTIASAPADSPLAEQAALLEDWLASQRALEVEYQQKVQRLETLLRSDTPLAKQDDYHSLLVSIDQSRKSLSPELGGKLDARVEGAKARWQELQLAASEEKTRELNKLERELASALSQAGKARSRSELTRIANAAQQRMEKIEALSAEEEDATRAKQLSNLLIVASNQLSEIATKWDALESEWQQLNQAAELENYLASLERIHSFDILPAEIKAAISRSLTVRTQIASLKSELLGPSEGEGSKAFFEFDPALNTEEQAFLDELMDKEVFKDVYVSTVQYFEGSAEEQSEYQTYLVEPLPEIESQEQNSHITFTFQAHGFDETGQPEPEPRDIQFISRSDGSFWGFFYKPSELAPESEYYERSIKNTLKLLASGADRLAIIDQLDALEKRQDLSPAFRLYWQRQLLEFMSLRPQKWGLAFSPSLKERSQELSKLPESTLTESTWLSTIEQAAPSPEFDALLKESIADTAESEIQALLGLFQRASEGRFAMVGTVSTEQTLDLFASIPEGETLWSVNALTGRVAPLAEGVPLTPFAPVLHYQLEDGGSLGQLLLQVEEETQLDFSEPPYPSLLPAIFRR